ncbi:MAG: hypothetical protein IPP64_12920 [Bacteroidetes bacterium]|nr:hypothetical protein [Bacteroidota bacterium]
MKQEKQLPLLPFSPWLKRKIKINLLRKAFYIIALLFSQSLFSQQKNDCEKLMELADSLYFSNPDSSYSVSIEFEKCARKSNDLPLIARSNVSLGRYLLLKSDLEEANIKLNNASKIYTDLNDWSGIGTVLKLKSNLQSRIGNENESTKLLDEALTMFRKGNNTKGIINSLLNLSIRYFKSKEFDKAEATLKEIEDNFSSLSKTDRYFFHQNKGIFLLETNRLDEAIRELNQAHAMAMEDKMIDSEATILVYIGKYYRLKKVFDESKTQLERSMTIAKENLLDHELSETYEELILLHKDMGNFEEAYNTLVLQTELKNKLLNIEKINTISRLEKKLALSEKEKEIEREKLNSQKAREQNQLLTYALIAMAIFCIFIIYLFVKSRSLKNEISIQNKDLERQNHIIEEKSKRITDSIQYAKRIQQSLLPTEVYIHKSIKRLKKK